MNNFDDFLLPMFLLERKRELDKIVVRILNGESISANLSEEECEYIINQLKNLS